MADNDVLAFKYIAVFDGKLLIYYLLFLYNNNLNMCNSATKILRNSRNTQLVLVVLFISIKFFLRPEGKAERKKDLFEHI
jgi:hypothetical protein